jgi:hypothetical protein
MWPTAVGDSVSTNHGSLCSGVSGEVPQVSRICRFGDGQQDVWLGMQPGSGSLGHECSWAVPGCITLACSSWRKRSRVPRLDRVVWQSSLLRPGQSVVARTGAGWCHESRLPLWLGLGRLAARAKCASGLPVTLSRMLLLRRHCRSIMPWALPPLVSAWAGVRTQCCMNKVCMTMHSRHSVVGF